MTKHLVDVYVGSKLRERRKELEISQGALSKRMNISFQQIQKYEKGINRISISKLYELSKILLISTNYFLEGYEESQEESKETENKMLSSSRTELQKDISRLLKNFTKINCSKLRNNLISIAKTMQETNNKK